MISRRKFLAAGSTLGVAGSLLSPNWLDADDNDSKPSKAKRDKKLRIVFVFTPNGMVRNGFWPSTEGKGYEIEPVLKPLEKYRDQMLLIKGICNHVRGDGDNHMRGMSSFLTAIELFPGNVQGGSHTPAGWAKGISIDQEIKNYLQKNEMTRTRFGSLEFGVCVRNDANPWTRWVYAGPNQPVAPISNPYAMYQKMYGRMRDQDNVEQVLKQLDAEFNVQQIADSDQAMLKLHANHIEKMRDRFQAKQKALNVVPPELPAGIANTRDNMPQLTRMQMDLMVNGFANDLNRVATLQFTESVGQPIMKWLEIKEGHHALSHDPDLNKESQAKLVKINTWYCEQLAYLVQQLEQTKDPETGEPLLDNTMILWANELGHGNSHTLNDIPILMIGGKHFGFEMGRYLKLKRVSHNRLWLTLANAMGHDIKQFGNPKFCRGGALDLSKK